MERKELLRRTLSTQARWGLGSIGCHDIVPPTQGNGGLLDEPPAEGDYLVITVDGETGNLTVTAGDTE